MLNTTATHVSPNSERIDAVIRHVENHLDGDLSLRRLSELTGFSPFHFHRQFRACTGMALGQWVRRLRLRQAAQTLVLHPQRSIIEIALDAGFDSADAFSRAFRTACGRAPSAFRRQPDWQPWHTHALLETPMPTINTSFDLIDFPSTTVAAAQYHGPEHGYLSATQRLIAWRQAQGIGPDRGATYALYYSDPRASDPDDFRMDICVSYAQPIASNPQGIVGRTIPGGRCARIRHHGPRDQFPEADYLYRDWLPGSGEQLRDCPLILHFLNVGPSVKPMDMITDIYLPLR